MSWLEKLKDYNLQGDGGLEMVTYKYIHMQILVISLMLLTWHQDVLSNQDSTCLVQLLC